MKTSTSINFITHISAFSACFCLAFFGRNRSWEGSSVITGETERNWDAPAESEDPLEFISKDAGSAAKAICAQGLASIKSHLERLFASGRLDQNTTSLSYQLMRGGAKLEPESLLDWVRERKFPLCGHDVLLDIFQIIANRSPEELKGLIGGLDDGEQRSRALQGVRMSDLDLSKKIALLTSFGNIGKQSAKSVISQLFTVSPLDAVKATSLLTSDYDRSSAKYWGVLDWAKSDLGGCLDWISANTESAEFATRLIRECIERAAEKDPVKSLTMIQKIPPGEARTSAMYSIYSSWAKKDIGAAMNSALSLSPSEGRAYVICSIAQQCAGQSFSVADRLLELADTKDTQNVIVLEAVSYPKDPMESITWARGLKSQELAVAAQTRAWNVWAQTKPLQAAEQAAQNWEDPGAREGYVVAIGQIAQQDAKSAMGMISNLPEERQGFAAKGLLARNFNGFSTEQIAQLETMSQSRK